jgi:hypothetical protein
VLRDLLRIIPLLGAAVSLVAFAATGVLLMRAEWTRRPNGKRRPPRAKGRYDVWPDPAAITPAGRPYERLARRTALVAILSLAAAMLALAAQ